MICQDLEHAANILLRSPNEDQIKVLRYAVDVLFTDFLYDPCIKIFCVGIQSPIWWSWISLVLYRNWPTRDNFITWQQIEQGVQKLQDHYQFVAKDDQEFPIPPSLHVLDNSMSKADAENAFRILHSFDDDYDRFKHIFVLRRLFPYVKKTWLSLQLDLAHNGWAETSLTQPATRVIAL